MACQVVIDSWSFWGLVSTFLDLVIAYFLLCCSTVAFFTAKFLSLFGIIPLPCLCNGLFGYPNHGPCLQRVLVDWPIQIISSIQLSVKTKFPFNYILPLPRRNHCYLYLKLVRENEFDDDGVEIEGEASNSWLSGTNLIGRIELKGEGKGKEKEKEKGAATHRQRYIRRHRRGSVDYGNLSSGSSYDHMSSDVCVAHWSPSDPSELGSDPNADDLIPVNSHDVQDPSVIAGKTLPDFASCDVAKRSNLQYDNNISFENLKNNVVLEPGGDCQDENAVRVLEEALQEEQVARDALCSELEQERSAAATAADEAMAMISRLQEEKASIEIEARQYQRILEEKTAYDAEEMNLLKEIIVRTERENHFLVKKVEAFRKMFQENGELESQVDDILGQNEASYSYVDPMLLLQKLGESVDEWGNVRNKNIYVDYGSASLEKKETSTLELDNGTKIVEGLGSPEYSIQDNSGSGDETSQEIQEKGMMLSMDEIPYPQSCPSRNSWNHDLLEIDTVLVGGQGHIEHVYPVREPHVLHDVHIIDSKGNVCNKSPTIRSDPPLMQNNSSNIRRKWELPFEAANYQRVDNSAYDSQRVDLDIVDRPPSLSSCPNRSFTSEFQPNSLSRVDQERLKIDSEIGWLRVRLRAVQLEKEKLLQNSLEFRERGKTEPQLLEDIKGAQL